MIDLKAVVASGFLAAGLALGAVGVSAGTANAAPVTAAQAGPQYIAENGPGRGHGHGHDDWGWDGPGPRGGWGWDGGGPGYWNPVDACIGVQGPFGYVQGSACI